MATYAIGDIHGCYSHFRRLLDKLHYNPDKDQLWLTGDLVNRGPESLATLRFIKSLQDSCTCTLGNHDLHLLAVAANVRQQKKQDTLQQILNAPDRESLLTWLRYRPVLHHDHQKKITMVHAGIPPIWSISQAKQHATELESQLQSNQYKDTLKSIFTPNKDPKNNTIKLIANYFTRMRFCDQSGQLELKNKTAQQQKNFHPWYDFPKSPCYHDTIIFGHWAALKGMTNRNNIHAIDSGCVWGNALTALNIDDFSRISLSC